jgi:CheY-like chemotaxis protein
MAPDAVLSDLVMPEEDGFALRGVLRAKESEIGRHIPTLVISALSDPEIERRAADEGFDAYFVKPCDFQEVVGSLARLTTAGSIGRPVRSSRVG